MVVPVTVGLAEDRLANHQRLLIVLYFPGVFGMGLGGVHLLVLLVVFDRVGVEDVREHLGDGLEGGVVFPFEALEDRVELVVTLEDVAVHVVDAAHGLLELRVVPLFQKGEGVRLDNGRQFLHLVQCSNKNYRAGNKPELSISPCYVIRPSIFNYAKPSIFLCPTRPKREFPRWPYKFNLMQQDLKSKQTYLRQAILEHNYDPEQFIHYLNERLHIDSDIDRCSMEELQEVVKMFIDQKESVIIENPVSISASQSLHRKPSDKPAAIVFKDYSPPVVEESFQITNKCIKISNRYTPEQLNKTKVEVSNPERKYAGGLLGLGATSYLEFQVSTQGPGWNVGRRYSDFIWLRNTLRKFYPTQLIPPIPNKKASKRTARHIEKRMKILTYFLNDLVKLPEMFNSRYVEGFLSLKDNAKFESLKKEADNKAAFESIASTQTQTGAVKIALSNDNVLYCSQLKKFITRSEVLYKQVTRCSKRFQAQKIDEVNQLYDMGNKFAQLYEAGRELETATKCPGSTQLNEIFIKLNNLTIEWGNNIKSEIELLEVNFNTFFKYARESYMGFKQFYERMQTVEQQYLSSKRELDARKEKIFLLHDPAKWEIPKKDVAYVPKSSIHERSEAFKIMLPRESVQVEKAKINYSFWLSRLADNSAAYFSKQVEKFNENFREFAIRNKVNNQQLGEAWNEMSAIFSDGNLGAKKLKQMQKIPQMKEGSSEVYNDD